MKNFVTLAVVMSLAVSGCANTSANPVPLAQVGDENKSCRAITSEMEDMKSMVSVAEGDRDSQVGKNVALGVAGAFFLVPWFFMDTGNAASVEQRAAQARFKRLMAMAEEKGCEVTVVATPAPPP